MAFDIDKTTDLTSDVYGINAYINEIKKKYNPNVKEDTLMLGIYGYFSEMFSTLIQNDIIMASEFANESIASKAKFEKNVIAHALGMGMTYINATPAQLDVLLTFIEDDIITWAGAKDGDGNDLPWEFTFDKDIPIYIGDYEFHTDYDIIIRKILLEHSGKKNKFAYSAKYLIDIDNPISEVKNPYLNPPVKMFVNGMNVIFVKCTLHQVEKFQIYKKVLSDNSISSKTAVFDFSGQLAAFTIDVKEGNATTHMVPVYDGIAVAPQKYPYFYYTYLDANTIRIKFDRYSYAPRINSDIAINLQTTQGDGGNFTFNPEAYPGFAIESEKYEYSNIGMEVRPVTGDSAYGTNKKTVDDLKKIIPKEALSRGSITNMADLENYFNMLNTELSKLYFYKKRDNALERLYYAFMVMKDKLNVIIPTNTIDICVTADQLQTEEGSMKLVFKKGQTIRLVDGVGYIYTPSEDGSVPDYGASFYYVIPYSFIINEYPLYGMYYLSTINTKKFLDFSFINEQCLYQYIATYITWNRGYITDPDKYKMSIELLRNIEAEGADSVYIRDEDGIITGINLRVIAVLYNEEGKAHRWAEGKFSRNTDEEMQASDVSTFRFDFEFATQDYIDIKNRIRIDSGIYDIGTNTEFYAHFDANVKCVLHILSKQEGSGLNGLDEIVPGLDGWVVSNSYTVVGGIDWFYDYSEIIESVITVNKEEEESPEDPDNPSNEGNADGGDTGTKDNISAEESIKVMSRARMMRSATSPNITPSHGTTDVVVPSPVPGNDDGTSEDKDPENPSFGNGELETDPDFKPDPGDNKDPITGLPIDPDTGETIKPDDPEPEPEGPKEWFTIKSVPVVKADYFTTEEKVTDFCAELVSRKNYIDYAIQVLEDAFGMDFKFFNTYGPSSLFTLDNKLNYINHTNLSLTFNIKLKPNYDTNVINEIVADIKDYIEDINEIRDLHMPNLITFITTKYSESLVFFEFVDMNGYGPGEQHLYSMGMPDGVITPEFLNIQALSDGTPDITLIMM